MSKDSKCYRVEIGMVDKGNDIQNFTSANVIAKDALEAARKVKIGKKEYIAQIEMLNIVDIE